MSDISKNDQDTKAESVVDNLVREHDVTLLDLVLTKLATRLRAATKIKIASD